MNRFWWPRRKKTVVPPEQTLGWALVHLGSAIRAHQEGDTLRAVRHLALASETIATLIEQWTGVEVLAQADAEAVAAGIEEPKA